MFIAALLILPKRQKQSRYPSTDEKIKQMWSIHVVEYHSALKNPNTCYNMNKPHAKENKPDT
jgi:hypothetical protein